MNAPFALLRRWLHLVLAVLAAGLLEGPIRAAERPPQEYIDHLNEAVRTFGRRDFAQTLKALDAAEKILPPTPLTLNTRGAVFIEQKEFERGIAQCVHALKLNPRFYPARFNLAEAAFMQGKYDNARMLFQKLLDENTRDELVMFRILLTYLREKNDTEARVALGHIPFPGDTAAYYFGNAAWEFAHGNDAEAQKWMARGNWVFTTRRTANFTDSLRQMGWVKVDASVDPNAAPFPNSQVDGSISPPSSGFSLENAPKP